MNVVTVSVVGSALGCFLVEWYQPALAGLTMEEISTRLSGAAQHIRGDGESVRLLLTLSSLADETLFGVFSACSAEDVDLTCRNAGWPPDRITSQVQAHIPVRGD